MAKRKNKMTTGEAVKILANETKEIKNNMNMMYDAYRRVDAGLRDYVSLFEHYMEFTKDGKDFVKHMTKLVEEKVNEPKTNEQPDGQDTTGDSKDKKVRTARIRP